jgi:ankyrin repeat protein
MKRLDTNTGLALWCVAVWIMVFSVNSGLASQGPGNTNDDPTPGQNPVPGDPDDEVGPVATVDSLNDAISSGDVEILKAVLASGVDPNVVDDIGYTPLGSAITLSATGITTTHGQVSALLAAGADPNRKNEIGDTPMHKAATDGDEALMKLLIAGGGSPQIANNKGLTPYELALKLGNTGAVSAIEEASEFRHPNRANLMLWGTFAKKISRFLATRPQPGPETDAKVREINQFLVDSGLITKEEKKDYDERAFKVLNESKCCGNRKED